MEISPPLSASSSSPSPPPPSLLLRFRLPRLSAPPLSLVPPRCSWPGAEAHITARLGNKRCQRLEETFSDSALDRGRTPPANYAWAKRIFPLIGPRSSDGSLTPSATRHTSSRGTGMEIYGFCEFPVEGTFFFLFSLFFFMRSIVNVRQINAPSF